MQWESSEIQEWTVKSVRSVPRANKESSDRKELPDYRVNRAKSDFPDWTVLKAHRVRSGLRESKVKSESSDPQEWTVKWGVIGPQGEQRKLGPQGEQGEPGAAAFLGLICPAGQAVVGFDAQGNLICAPFQGLSSDCSNGAVQQSIGPNSDIVVCEDLSHGTCEQDFGSLCPFGWHLCSSAEFNVRNDGWSFPNNSPTNALGNIQCRTSASGAGHFTLLVSNLGLDEPNNCVFGSSRTSCPATFGCNELVNSALCCAPLPSCGNGVVDDPQEVCDDGNNNNEDACLNNCYPRFGFGLGCGQ